MALAQNFVTPETLKFGIGAVDMKRFARSIDQIGLTFEFKARPSAADVFTAEYLPPLAQRQAK